jgi:hypothetical protein
VIALRPLLVPVYMSEPWSYERALAYILSWARTRDPEKERNHGIKRKIP